MLQRLLSNDLRRLPEGGAQYGLICSEAGGVLDDLITYRLAECHFLTVTNAANHERDLAWFQRQAREFDADVLDRRFDFAMLAVQGPRARALVAGLSDGSLPPRMHFCQRTVAGVPMLVCGTGYTGEDGVELLLEPDKAAQVWDALLAAGVTPAGLGARDTLRLEACFHLYGNDLSEDRGPIEAGLGWCCREQTGFIGSEEVARSVPHGPPRSWSRSRSRAQASLARATPIAGGGVVTSGTFSPCLKRGIGMAYVAAGAPSPVSAWRSTSGARRAPRWSVPSPSTERRPEVVADASYPEDLLYHPEHDWARIDSADPTQATFGITWYAQDALGEVVFFDPPEIGTQVTKDSPYTEVESVKAVSDVISPLSGEVVAVNEALTDKPETINEDPYGEGWLVKVKLSDPAEQETLLDSSAYEATLA